MKLMHFQNYLRKTQNIKLKYLLTHTSVVPVVDLFVPTPVVPETDADLALETEPLGSWIIRD